MSDSSLAVELSVPPELERPVQERLRTAAQEEVGRRLRAGDATLWAPAGTPEVADRLGWLTIAERMLAELGAIEAFAAEARAGGATDAVLLGMGGSSLAPEVLRRTFAAAGGLRLHVLDSTDAGNVRAVQAAIDPARTLFIVSSKSGGTIEPLSLLAHFRTLAEPGAFVAITDPGTKLARLAAEQGFRRTFHGDPDIGGRYSALSAFGVVPGALLGADVRALLEGAADAWRTPLAGQEEHTAGAALGVALGALARAGRDKLTFVIAPSLPGLGLWLEQLFAESTGKHGTGILPIADEPLLDPGAYGGDRVFAHLTDGAPGADDERVRALAAAGHPMITIPTRGPLDLGRVFLLAEIAVAAAGWALQINPFDQPNVQQAKDATNRVLAGYEQDGSLPDVPSADTARLRELLLEGSPPDYVALMAYAPFSDALEAAAGELRELVMRRARTATTFGYGPRFLHSTGQFHKGGPPTGRFLQLVYDAPPDVAIPDAPYSFTTLKGAQATGDLQTLRKAGLPAERVRLQGDDPAAALRALVATLEEEGA